MKFPACRLLSILISHQGLSLKIEAAKGVEQNVPIIVEQPGNKEQYKFAVENWKEEMW